MIVQTLMNPQSMTLWRTETAVMDHLAFNEALPYEE
jgi:hypothetical protein